MTDEEEVILLSEIAFTPRDDGQWFEVTNYLADGHLLTCCDCALVHLVELRAREGDKIDIKFTRRDDLTNKRRLELGVRVIK